MGPSGLFVLCLGSLVLLTGLAKPDPMATDLLVPSAAVDRLIPWSWLAGWGMIGLVLVTVGLRQQARKLVLLAILVPLSLHG